MEAILSILSKLKPAAGLGARSLLSAEGAAPVVRMSTTPAEMGALNIVKRSVNALPPAEGPNLLNKLQDQFKLASNQAEHFQTAIKKVTAPNLQPAGPFNAPELTKTRDIGTRGAPTAETQSALLDTLHTPGKLNEITADPNLSPAFKKTAQFVYDIWHGTLDKADVSKVIPELLDDAGQSMRQRTYHSYEPQQYNIHALREMGPDSLRSIVKNPNIPDPLRQLSQDLLDGKAPVNVKSGYGSEINTDFLKKKNLLSDEQREALGGLADPVYSHSLRLQQLGFDIAHKNFIDGMKAKGFLSPEMKAGFVPVESTIPDVNIRKMMHDGGFDFVQEGMAKEYADFLKNHGNFLAGSDNATKLMRSLGSVNNLWKNIVTVKNPKVLLTNWGANKAFIWVAHGNVPYGEANLVMKMRENSPVFNLARESGLFSGGLKNELGELSGAGKTLGLQFDSAPIEKGKAILQGIWKTPDNLYHNVEDADKLAIFIKELKQSGVNATSRGVEYRGQQITPLQFAQNPRLMDIARSAADSAHQTLIHYGRQSRAIKYLRSMPGGIPFVTFYANIFPNMARWAMGLNNKGRFDPLIMLRAWSIPGLLYALNYVGEKSQGLDKRQAAELRDSLPEYYRKSNLSNPILPFSLNKQGIPVSPQTPGSNPAILPMGSVAPLDPFSSTTGAVDIPSIFHPAQDFLSQTGSLLLTGKDPFTKKDVIPQYAPTGEKMTAAGKEILKKFLPSLFPGSSGFEKISNAVKGIPNSNYEAPQNPAMAALGVTTPFRPIAIDRQQSQVFKRAQAQKFIADLKMQLRKDFMALQRTSAGMTPEQIRAAQMNIIMKAKKAQEDFMRQQYPRTYQPAK